MSDPITALFLGVLVYVAGALSMLWLVNRADRKAKHDKTRNDIDYLRRL